MTRPNPLTLLMMLPAGRLPAGRLPAGRLPRLGLVVAVLLLTAVTAVAETPQEKGYRIMAAIDALPVFERVMAQNELRIFDRQDKLLFVKQFRIARYFKDFRDVDKRLSRSINYFFAPADDKGNGTLTIEIPGSDDDEQYLYLRQTRKVRRIIGSSKSDDFMGSDFTLGDIVPRELEDFNFTWLGSDVLTVRNARIKTEKIETRFKSERNREDYNEGKAIIWVHPASGLVFKSERYDITLELSRTSTIKGIARAKNRDGKAVFYPTAFEMRNVNRGTRSEFLVKNRLHESKARFKITIFTKDSLTRRWW